MEKKMEELSKRVGSSLINGRWNQTNEDFRWDTAVNDILKKKTLVKDLSDNIAVYLTSPGVIDPLQKMFNKGEIINILQLTKAIHKAWKFTNDNKKLTKMIKFDENKLKLVHLLQINSLSINISDYSSRLIRFLELITNDIGTSNYGFGLKTIEIEYDVNFWKVNKPNYTWHDFKNIEVVIFTTNCWSLPSIILNSFKFSKIRELYFYKVRVNWVDLSDNIVKYWPNLKKFGTCIIYLCFFKYMYI